MHFELTHQALSTILLDAIQFYPSYGQAKEAYGILLGTEEEDHSVAEYSFPVGNVKSRELDSVTENREISSLIRNARKVVATSTTVASYHSHPYGSVYEGWTKPSNGDCFCVISQEVKAELIIAIAKVYKEEQPLTFHYRTDDAIEYIPSDNEQDCPIESKLGKKVQYIEGTFGCYHFEVRAYFNTTSSLKNMDLFSSEVRLNEILRTNEIPIERLPAEAMYSVRKIEYASRERVARNANDKIQYHIDKIKRVELAPLPSVSSRLIDGNQYIKKSSISYEEAIRWARGSQLYADLLEDSLVLFKVGFDEKAGVLFMEDLEKEIGTTIDLADYMIEAGYVEQISLGNVQRFPLHFWLLKGVV